ncbi:MAG: two-component sensor histidine kinase [Deltaproteobacteria bacterium]|nr:two-component sensor histidine kinase [Deltaproteobacteria bacterium]
MKKDHYSSVRKSILSSMILVPVIPLLLILGIGYYYFTISIETKSVSSKKRIVEDHRQMIETFLAERKADLEFICSSYEYSQLSNPDTIQSIFKNLQKNANAFVDLGVFDGKGMHVAYAGPFELKGKEYGETEWFREVNKKGYYISDVFLGFRRIPHFIIALKNGSGEGSWVIRATIDTYMFNELVKKVRIGSTGEAYILNRNGIFQTERRSGGSLMEKDPDNIGYPSHHEGIKTFISRDISGEKYLYATTWLKAVDWQLVVRQQEKDAFRELRTATYLDLLISIIAGGIIIALAFYMTGRIIRRMERMDAERQSLSGQLVRATQLAELGEMAAGFAHEINNPLQIINNEQALMKDIFLELKEKGDLGNPDLVNELEESMEEIHAQIGRCTRITQSILKFGRRNEPSKKYIELKNFINEVTGMVEQRATVHAIEIIKNIPEDLPPVNADPTQLQQVFLNLFNNAIDAIIERYGASGGRLEVATEISENDYFKITVSDNGSGISEENMSKVFSPFFTTKPVGKGTGLGLSVCYGIIKEMGGEMKVESEKNRGTVFTIILPSSSK